MAGERHLAAMGARRFVQRATTAGPRATPVSVEVSAESEAPGQVESSPAAPHLDALRIEVAGCTRCALAETRNRTVFGVGEPGARVMVIGEAPGADEDRLGEPFVGRAGKLLDAMLRAAGAPRDTVYIANILKCRPPRNRDPSGDEVASCIGYLHAQIERVAPSVLLAVGRIAAQNLLGSTEPLGRLRGRRFEYRGVPLLVTYHPAYLLRSPAQKAAAWRDLKGLMAELRSTRAAAG